jgi:ELWxxDGT repeat protein
VPGRVADINPAGDGVPSDAEMVAVDGTVFFVADDGSTGRELWTSDGIGATLVEDTWPGQPGSDPRHLTVVGSRVFFTADDGSGTGRELWVSDGTAPGTGLVKDIGPGSVDGPSGSVAPVPLGDTLFFVANDGASGFELWRSDGTEGGTLAVDDLEPSPGYGSYPTDLTAAGSKVFFAAQDGITGRQLWSTSESAGGADMVLEITGEAAPEGIRAVGDSVFFWARDADHGVELWTSDGTMPGTHLVDDLTVGTGDTTFDEGVGSAGRFFFTADTGSGTTLWVSDGTAGGTAPLTASGGAPHSLTDSGGALFFSAFDGGSGRELWTSDGTVVGTAVVSDINPGYSDSGPSSLTDVAGRLYFGARTGLDRELWSSDGTPVGTSRVADVNVGGSAEPRTLTNAAGDLFFVADDGTTGFELWALPAEVAPPPPPAVPPITAPKRGRADAAKGTLTLKVSAPAAGSLVVGSVGKPLVRTVTKNPATAGRVTVTLKPTRLGKRKLKQKLARALNRGQKVGKLGIKIRFEFDPTSGASSSATKKYTLKLKKK